MALFNEFNSVVIKLRKYFGRINMIQFVKSTYMSLLFCMVNVRWNQK